MDRPVRCPPPLAPLPVLSLTKPSNPTVWLNDAWTAHEIFEKKAQVYASRPRMVVFGELGSGQSSLVTMQIRNTAERDRWRVHRKLMHAGVGSQAVRGYRAIQDGESKVVALDLLRDPANFVKHLERYATSVVSVIAFGRRVARADDPIITEVIALMQLAADLNVPGKTFPMLLETFPSTSPSSHPRPPANPPPVLAKAPRFMPYFRSLGTRSQKSGHYFFHTLALEALAQHAAKPPNSLPITPYVTTIFTASAAMDPPLPVPELSSLVSSLFGAGADTSSSTLITFLLACCAFPAAVAAAQRELDAVVGTSRSPTWDDRPRLPYVDAFVKEVFRWRSVAIIGGQPHAPTQDDTYKGWKIPRGTWVQGNVWAIHRNEREFPEPDRFAPERFLEGSELWRPFPGERGYMTFGWGRRVCSGQALAEQGTWITVARVLWGFRVEAGVDARTGREREVDIFAFTNGLNMRPQPFECEIAPRSDEVRATMEREGREALEELQVYDGESEYRMSTFYKAMKDKVGEEPVVDEEGNIKIVKVKA